MSPILRLARLPLRAAARRSDGSVWTTERARQVLRLGSEGRRRNLGSAAKQGCESWMWRLVETEGPRAGQHRHSCRSARLHVVRRNIRCLAAQTAGAVGRLSRGSWDLMNATATSSVSTFDGPARQPLTLVSARSADVVLLTGWSCYSPDGAGPHPHLCPPGGEMRLYQLSTPRQSGSPALTTSVWCRWVTDDHESSGTGVRLAPQGHKRAIAGRMPQTSCASGSQTSGRVTHCPYG